MAVKCSNCGEELLGAVNRCWKCGSMFVAPPTAEAVPPVRRSPIPVDFVTRPAATFQTTVDAVLLEPDAGTLVAATNGDSPAAAQNGQAPLPSKRRGSPFTDSHTAQLRAAQAPAPVLRTTRPRAPQADHARDSAATGGAVAATLLGVLGLCSAYYVPEGALVTAVLGIGMGLWGLYSRQRGLAIAGLLLCCLTLGIGGFLSAIKLYVMIHGRHPWELDPSLQSGPSDGF